MSFIRAWGGLSISARPMSAPSPTTSPRRTPSSARRCSSTSTWSAEGITMHVTLVHVQVKPDHVQDFINAACANHIGSVKEAGNRRFDILQSADDPARFVLYEAYASPEDAAAHK